MKRSLFVGLSMIFLAACEEGCEEKKQVKFQRVCVDPDGFVVPEEKCQGASDAPQSTPHADPSASSPPAPASVSPPAPSASVGYGVTGGWIGPPVAPPEEHHDSTTVVVVARPTPVYHWWYSSSPYVAYSPGSRVVMTTRTGSFTPSVGRVYSSSATSTTVMGARGGVAVSRGFVGGSFRGGTVTS